MEESKYARTLALQKDQNQVRSITIITLVPNRIKLEKLGTKQREQKLIGRGDAVAVHYGTAVVLSGDEQVPRELCLWCLPHHFS